MRGGIWAGVFVCAGTALWSACIAEAAAKAKPQISAETLKHAIEGKTGSVQLITFPATAWRAVRIVRGGSPARNKSGQKPVAEKAERPEIVTFADPRRSPVRVLRGDSERGLAMPGLVHPAAMTMQVVTFADLRDRPVSILRGAGLPATTETELFGPASAADLDRVAFAVDGAESSHGADLRMWRPEPGGPQGPMQVSAAAAFDVGGGDRFDLAQNRALGRAYLAQMYRRYGNWQDAIAAYNWAGRSAPPGPPGQQRTDRQCRHRSRQLLSPTPCSAGRPQATPLFANLPQPSMPGLPTGNRPMPAWPGASSRWPESPPPRRQSPRPNTPPRPNQPTDWNGRVN